MRIFVTGGTGFIGGHFLRAACAAGHDVVASRRPGALARFAWNPGVQVCEKAVSHLEVTDMRSIDVVVHFSAAGVSPQRTTWRVALDHNVVDQLHLLETAIEAGVRRIVCCGSCVEYGRVAERYAAIPPDAPLEPEGAYAASKAAGGLAAVARARGSDLEMAYLRVFNAFGDGQGPASFWSSLREAAHMGVDFPMTTGEQIRDFVEVEHVAAVFLAVAVDRRLAAGRPEVHNVGTGAGTTVLAFAQAWWARWQAQGRLLPGAVPHGPHEVMRYVPALTM